MTTPTPIRSGRTILDVFGVINDLPMMLVHEVDHGYGIAVGATTLRAVDIEQLRYALAAYDAATGAPA